MKPVAVDFQARARESLQDSNLAVALGRARKGFIDSRSAAVEALAGYDELRRCAQEIKEHTLSHLDHYLERFEAKVREHGGQVHWANTPAEAQAIIVDICRKAKAKRITKGKSMVGEEIAVNEALEAAGFEAIETDLGEYIIQLADEPPSHIIAPAIHKTRDQVSDLFHLHHAPHGYERQTEPEALVAEARSVLREKFTSADVGITGANFLVAETGSSVIVTNEGNGDLTNTLPEVHIVTAGIEKVIPNLEDMSTILRVLARNATGQESSVYTTLSSGPRRTEDLDGPREYHVVLLDNGRSQMLGNEFHEMLRCIRCGACMNHCPVYHAIGGQAYGWVYVGPMGSVLTPLLVGLDQARDLPEACTLNGRCKSVCPMGIPLPDLMRNLRRRSFQKHLHPPRVRLGLRAWGFVARRPRLYRLASQWGAALLGRLGQKRGRFRRLPFASGWTDSRDFPAPQGRSFISAWAKGERGQQGETR